MPMWCASSWTTVIRTSSSRSSGSGKSSSRGSRKIVIAFGNGTSSAPHSVRGTPSYRPYRVSSDARPSSRRCSRDGSSAMTIATSRSAAANGIGMPASARSTSSSNRVWRASRRRRSAARSAAGIPRRRFGMARLSYGAMELTHGRPFIGHGFGAFDLDAGGTPAPDLAAEPEGFMVAMDAAVRIHFLDWGEPAETADVAPGVLLIHGLAQTAWSWASIARRLRAGAHVAAMDLRGHGLSDAPTDGYDPDQLARDAIAVAEGAGLLAFADEPHPSERRGGRPFVVAGHGYGAVVAAWTANALGDRCAGLVLVDGGWTDVPAATGMTPDEWLAAIAEPPEVLG